MFEYIQRHTTFKWASKFLVDLKRCYEPPGQFHYEKTSFGANWQIIKFKQGFKELEQHFIEDRYLKCDKRIIIID